MARLIPSALLLALLPAALACTSGMSSLDPGREVNCHGLECPRYQSIETGTNKFEERNYESARWVKTEVMSMERDPAVRTGFRRLFDYISGENDQGIKIDMTAPVATQVIPGDGPTCESNFTVHFFVPTKYQAEVAPPQPTNPDVSLVDLPQMKVYVRSFAGFAEDADWLREGAQLGADLAEAGRKFDSSYYYTAGYDSPFRLLFRHNEVWFAATD